MSNGDGGSSGDAAPRVSRAVGAGVRPLAALVVDVQDVVAGFDPELVLARDAMDMVTVFSDLEHSASAGLALAARRVAQTNLWEHRGHRSAAHWLAATTGKSVGEAMRLLETAELAEKAPATMDALRNGALSIPKANAAGKAEATDPEHGAALVRQAVENEALSVKEIEQDAARIVNAASRDTEAEKAEKIHRNRRYSTGSNGDGSSWTHIYGPTAELARLDAAMKPLLNDIFIDAREQGRREPHEAYAFDALMALAGQGALPAATPEAVDDPGVPRKVRVGSDEWRFAEVIFRVDFAAYQRGRLEPGELCEIAGQGPVPLTTVTEAVDGGAFVAALSMKGTEIDKVIHLGRRPTALQRTALRWDSGGICVVEGCTNAVRLEHEHVKDWAATHVTRLRDLALLCKRCHDLKTYKGYRVGPRLPNGGRRLIPPGGADHGPQEATGAGPDDSGPPPDTDPTSPDGSAQPGLFDTS